MTPPRIAVLPGTFDPVTHGHLDIIQRGRSLFDRVLVGVSGNPGKAPLLPLDERVRLLRLLVREWPDVHVEPFSGMTVDFAREAGTNVILRGLRTFADFEYEFQLALANRLMGGVETIFIVTSAEKALIRSTLIKEAVSLGADVSAFIPPEAAESVRRHLASRQAAPAAASAGSSRRMSAADRSGGGADAGLGGHEAPGPGKRGSGLRGEGVD